MKNGHKKKKGPTPRRKQPQPQSSPAMCPLCAHERGSLRTHTNPANHRQLVPLVVPCLCAAHSARPNRDTLVTDALSRTYQLCPCCEIAGYNCPRSCYSLNTPFGSGGLCSECTPEEYARRLARTPEQEFLEEVERSLGR